jgi:L-seryl-tRNA(Ser) seleniumtransferase
VGEKIAEWTHNEAAYISCGAAAGIVLSTAACITGLDPEKRERLPFTDGMKNEIIAHRCGVEYGFTIQQAGGRVVLIGTEQGASADDLEQAINERTAAIFVVHKNGLMDGQVPLEEQIAIGKRHGVPVIVDAAAQIPPVENLWRFTHLGADLVIFSGGKGLCGPQSSGLILGRRDLVAACAFNTNPAAHRAPDESGKEEIVGLLAAVRWSLNLDHAHLYQTYEEQVAWMVAGYPARQAYAQRRAFRMRLDSPFHEWRSPWMRITQVFRATSCCADWLPAARRYPLRRWVKMGFTSTRRRLYRGRKRSWWSAFGQYCWMHLQGDLDFLNRSDIIFPCNSPPQAFQM